MGFMKPTASLIGTWLVQKALCGLDFFGFSGGYWSDGLQIGICGLKHGFISGDGLGITWML